MKKIPKSRSLADKSFTESVSGRVRAESLNMRVRASERGVTLLEVLIAVVILAVGLLGMAGLQVNSLRANQSAMMRTQAVSQAYDVIDGIRADMPNLLGYHNTIVDLSALMPGGQAVIAVNGPMITVTVTWDDRAAGGPAAGQVAVTTMMEAP